MGIPGLINELGAGERISLAKFCVRFLAGHSRPPRIAIDVSIWLFQAQAGRGGANPELRTLFYRLARLVALPVHPLFVFDGPERPAYKRGKLIQRSGNSAGHVNSLAKRLIELFRFPWHAAPGEAEAECAKLQTEGVVDAVMSDDVDAIMFGSTVTMRNFSRDSRGTGAATHVNVCRTADTADGESNVSLDQGGMILFALLSGGDYLPAGVPRCGPKLAGEIARAQFGTDLLEIIRESALDMDQKLREWRERLEYELHTNESGYFRCRHKAILIPEDFPDSEVLFDYVCPVTSSRSELKKACSSWVWDRDLNVQQLRAFICEELNWNYSLGAKRLIRTVAPQLISQRLRLGLPIVPGNKGVQITNRRENFGLDGMSELKIQFVPADVIELDWESEDPLPSSQISEALDEDPESEAAPEDNEDTGIFKKRQYRSYDPAQPDSAWILECIVTQGLPDMVAAWHAEQAKKKAQKEARVSKKTTTRRKGPKVLDPSMKPGAILKFGSIVKGPVGSNKPSPESTPVSSGQPLDSYVISPGASQLSNPHAAYAPRTKTGASDPTSAELEADLSFNFSEDGIPPPSSPVSKFEGPNELYSSPRYIDDLNTSFEKLELSPTGDDIEAPSKNRPKSCPSPVRERCLRPRRTKDTPKEADVTVGTKSLSIADKPRSSARNGGANTASTRKTRSSTMGKPESQPPVTTERSRQSRKPSAICEGNDMSTAKISQPKISTGATKSKSRKDIKVVSDVSLDTPSSTTSEQRAHPRKKTLSQNILSNRQAKSQKANIEHKETCVTIIDLCEDLSTTDLSSPGTISQDTVSSEDLVTNDGNSPKRTNTQKSVSYGETKRRLSGIIETKNGTWTYRPKKDGEDDTNTSASSQANSTKPVKVKRIARVSILDLT